MRPVDWKEVISRLTVVVIGVVLNADWIFVRLKSFCGVGGLERPCRLDYVEDRALFGFARRFYRFVHQLVEVRG